MSVNFMNKATGEVVNIDDPDVVEKLWPGSWDETPPKPSPNTMPFVAAYEWERREKAYDLEQARKHSRAHGVTNSREYRRARAAAGLR